MSERNDWSRASKQQRVAIDMLQSASKILLVDDKPENLFAMEATLKRESVEIFTALSGPEALSLLLRHDFALALLDVQMPEMDGFELAELMRANEKTRYIPIIFVTAISKEKKHVFKGYDSGAVDYLFKPIDVEILRHKIRVFQVLDQQKRSLEQLVEELSQTKQELERAKEDLEKRVANRTLDLQRANDQLTLEINERMQAEEEMRRLQNYLGRMIDSMPSMVVGVDLEGRVTQWNREAEKASGTTAVEAQGRAVLELLPQMGEQMGMIQEAIRLNQPQNDERVSFLVNDEHRIKDIAIYPIVDDGVTGAVIRIDDVTERVRLDVMLIQSEKMLSVGSLAAGMAHEINNPLAGIMQGAQVIKQRLSKKLAKNIQIAEECGTTMSTIEEYIEKRELTQCIDKVMGAGRQAAKIVNSILNFVRAGDSLISSHALSDLLDQTVELAQTDYDLKENYDFRRIEIVREFDQGLPTVNCCGGDIIQVFLNILKNGAQAMSEYNAEREKNGEDVPPPCFILRLVGEEDMVRIEIEDNGPGMSEEVRKRVFEPFFTTQNVGKGTGLGLSVAYFIVSHDHGGTMVVESAPGQGTRFIIRLPMKMAK